MDEFPPADMQAGDSYLMNDPFRGGIHTNDLAVFSPVRAGGQLYLTGAIVHVADLGGMSAGGLPAEAREVFHEGILIPPVRLRQAGTMRREIADLLALNSRTPEKVLGDTRALVAATCVGTERLEELATEWDRDLSPIWDELLRYTEARLRSEIAQLPLGEWQAQFTVDGDGVSACENTVRITLRHATPGDIEVDFTGTGPQAAGPINSAYSQSVSGAIVGIHCFLSNDIPMNEGVFRAIGTVLPLGSLVNPRKPAAVNARVVVVAAIVEGIIEIMGRLLPDRAVAPSSLHHIYTLSGRDGAWIYVDIEYGGIGGRRDRDGVNGSGP
jgi:N-methylhydantoinase B